MVNGIDLPHVASVARAAGTVRASLVNGGQDTELTFRDGSTIVLKGVTRLDAVLPAAAGLEASPIGGEVGGDGKRAHRRRNGGEGLAGVGE